jgi:hypothetical protein
MRLEMRLRQGLLWRGLREEARGGSPEADREAEAFFGRLAAMTPRGIGRNGG